MMKTMTTWNKVCEFHQAMGLPVCDDIRQTTSKQVALRTDLIKEEVMELGQELVDLRMRAWEKRPIKEELVERIIKEMADVVYVVYGLAVTYGIDLDVAINRVHQSNMSKLVDGKVAKRADGKVLKGEGYEPPSMEGLS